MTSHNTEGIGQSSAEADSAAVATPLLATRDSRGLIGRVSDRLVALKRPIVAFAAVGTVLGGLAGWWNSYRTVRSTVEPTVATQAQDTAVKPYSAADRRMTFAVLPFHAATGDDEAAALAQTAFDSVQSLQEGRTSWARVTPRAMVAQAVATPSSFKQIGKALDVHFLLRGNITRTAAGHALELTVLDAASETPLSQRSIAADASGATPRFPSQSVDFALGWLTYAALMHEVAVARAKPDSALDVRDLGFRAYADWGGQNTDRAAAYAKARQSLDRALALSPDDRLALKLTAEVNLCECMRGWVKDTTEMERIGEAALDKVLAIDPGSLGMLELRAALLLKRERPEDALLVVEQVLAREPDSFGATAYRVVAQFELGQFQNALAAVPAMLKAGDSSDRQAFAAAVHFSVGDDAEASRLARKALVGMTAAERADPFFGVVALVLVAAESRAGRLDRAQAALKDFHAAVPQAETIAQIKAWRLPYAVMPDSDVFWQALQAAGVGA